MANKKKGKKESKSRKSARPKQPDLPGMESRMFADLHEAAGEYAEIRDERMRLNEAEGDLKKRVRELMHNHELKKYTYDDVEITLVPPEEGEEDVKVRVKKKKEGAEAE